MQTTIQSFNVIVKSPSEVTLLVQRLKRYASAFFRQSSWCRSYQTYPLQMFRRDLKANRIASSLFCVCSGIGVVLWADFTAAYVHGTNRFLLRLFSYFSNDDKTGSFIISLELTESDA